MAPSYCFPVIASATCLSSPVHCFDWLYLLPLGSAALTPHWTPSGQGPAHELGTGSRALRRERVASSGLGEGGGGAGGGGEGGGAGPAGGSGGDPTRGMVQVPGARAELPG